MKDFTYTTTDDKSPGAPSGANFSPLPQTGFYVVEVASTKMSEYKASDVTYRSIRPNMSVIELKADDGGMVQRVPHTIQRHDLTVGSVNANGFYRKDGDTSKSPIWFTADSFFQSVGAYTLQDNGSSKLNLDMDFMRGRVVKGLFRYETYCKADKAWKMYADDLDKYLQAEHGYTEADLLTVELKNLIDIFNVVSEENGYEKDENIRVKSVPVKFWALTPEQAERDGYHQVNGITFITEEDYDTFMGLQALAAIDEDNDDPALQL